jgi:chromosome segregation ATPase
MNDGTQKLMAKVGKMFGEAVDAEVVSRTKKYKASNDSLRKELAEAKAKIKGLEDEFDPQVKRAQAAEKRVGELESRVSQLNVTIESLQKTCAELQAQIPQEAEAPAE